MFVRTPIMFDAAADGGTGGDPAPAPVADPAAVPAPAPSGDPAPAPAPAGDPAPVDYAAKVTEWGGEDAVQRALRIDAALGTSEGQETLIRQGLELRGFNPAQIDAFLASNKPAPAPAGESIEDLLKDPERVLTAAEIQRVLEARDTSRQQQQDAQATATRVATSINDVVRELQIPDANRAVILNIADQFLPIPGEVPDNPAQIKAAIEKGVAEFARQVREEAKALVEGKGLVHSQLPTPLPAAGGGGGVETPQEPNSVAEASARVRARHGIGGGTT
jgi:hypothetical protein